MQTLQDVQQDVKIDFAFYVGDGQAQRNEAAYHLGYETGLTGGYPQATQMYEIDSGEWDSYAEGYEAGRYALAPIFASMKDRNEFMVMIGEDMSEADFMNYTVDNLRSGRLTMQRLTDEQMEEIENERIGDDFSRYPFYY